jgi:hypothetical protein
MTSTIRPTTSFHLELKLSEEEARASKALVGYDEKESLKFLEAFYETMGKSYLKSRENGYWSLTKSIKEQIVPQLTAISEVWKKINELNKKE